MKQTRHFQKSGGSGLCMASLSALDFLALEYAMHAIMRVVVGRLRSTVQVRFDESARNLGGRVETANVLTKFSKT